MVGMREPAERGAQKKSQVCAFGLYQSCKAMNGIDSFPFQSYVARERFERQCRPSRRNWFWTLQNLKHLAIECPKCRSEVVFDSSNTKNGIPKQVSCLPRRIRSVFHAALASYREFYTSVSKSSYKVGSHISVTD